MEQKYGTLNNLETVCSKFAQWALVWIPLTFLWCRNQTVKNPTLI